MKMNSENTFISINGKMTKFEDAKISVLDRGFLFGDSIYEVSYSKDGSILFLDEHIDRLYNSAELLSIPIFQSREDIIKNILETLSYSKIKNAYFRIVITRGESDLSLDPRNSTHNNTIIIVKPRPVYEQELYESGIDLLLSSVIRNPKTATDPNAKSGNYLNSVMAIQEAKEKGFSDAIMMNKEGQLTEGSSFNFWLIRGNKILTPKSEFGLLQGITRSKVLELKELAGFSIVEAELREEDIHTADEAFITSSTRAVMPVSKIHTSSGLKSFETFSKTRLVSENYNQNVQTHILETKYKY